MLAGHSLWAQAPDANPRRIDVHSHYAPPARVSAVNAKEGNEFVGNAEFLNAFKDWPPARSIEQMDQAGAASKQPHRSTDIERGIKPNTRLISMMLANNETGVLQPVEEVGKIAAAAGAFFHIDAVQGAGKVPFDVKRFGCHLCSISAHKMHGPKGMGAMYVRRGTPIEPMMVGGSHERRQRAGTENVPGIVGLGKAAEFAMESLANGTIDRLAALRDRLEAGILQLPGTRVNGGWAGDKKVPRTANTTNIAFEQVEGEAMVIALDLKGVAVSGGSACHSGSTEPSHVLMAMGLDKNAARASLRFSLMKTATDADVDHVLKVVPEAVERLRALSPVAAGTAG